MSLKVSEKLMKRSNIDDIIIILINIILNIVILLLSDNLKYMEYDKWLKPFAVLALVQLLINIVSLVTIEHKVVSLTTIFMLFSFITHLGILIIFGFEINIDLPWNPLISISKEAYREANSFTVLCHAFLAFGMCISSSKRKKYYLQYRTSKINKFEDRELYLTKIIGKALVIIGIIPLLYYDINRFILYRTGGYLATYEVNASGFIITIGRMTEIGALLLLIGNKKNIRRANFILLIILIYQGIIILTGNRMRPIMFLLVVFFIYCSIIKKIRFTGFIKICLLLYISGFLLVFVGYIRGIPVYSLGIVKKLFIKSFQEFSVFKVLAEFGVTIVTLGHSLVLFPRTRAYQYGTNYLAAMLTVFPNVNGVLTETMTKVIYIYNWPSYIRKALGGSYLGEVYYSFGKYGFILCFFIGLMVAFVSGQIHRYIYEKRYIKLSYYLILCINLLSWPRGYIGDLPREFIWTSLCIIVIYKFINYRFDSNSTIKNHYSKNIHKMK